MITSTVVSFSMGIVTENSICRELAPSILAAS